jgi:serine/threonine protein kinase
VLYIDMRFVEGASLKDELSANGPLEPKRATWILTQVAAALDAAHSDGLVHRDIKPENVLLTPDDFAYLVDFGIAHAGGDPSVTQTGMLIGSCAYMSAERFSGDRVGPPADIYALTCLLYESLTGRPPFEIKDMQQLISAHMFSPPPRPSIMRRGIRRDFDDVVARGMAKDPTQRFTSAGELAKAAAVAAASTGAPLAAASPPPSPPPAAAASPPPSPPAAASPPPSKPPSTRQFSAVYPNPAATGFTPYPPPVHTTKTPARKPRFGRSQVALVAVTIVMLGVAAVLATRLIVGSDTTDNTSPMTTLLAPPPPSATTETTTETTTESPTTTTTTPTTTTPTTTSTTPTTSTSSAVPGADGLGFVGHSARCDPGSSPAALVRTAQSLAVVCESAPDTFYYRGERLRDGANIELANAVRSSGGFDVTNPADGTRYEVRPDRLTIISNGRVDTSEPVLQYATD